MSEIYVFRQDFSRGSTYFACFNGDGIPLFTSVSPEGMNTQLKRFGANMGELKTGVPRQLNGNGTYMELDKPELQIIFNGLMR